MSSRDLPWVIAVCTGMAEEAFVIKVKSTKQEAQVEISVQSSASVKDMKVGRDAQAVPLRTLFAHKPQAQCLSAPWCRTWLPRALWPCLRSRSASSIKVGGPPGR